MFSVISLGSLVPGAELWTERLKTLPSFTEFQIPGKQADWPSTVPCDQYCKSRVLGKSPGEEGSLGRIHGEGHS